MSEGLIQKLARIRPPREERRRGKWRTVLPDEILDARQAYIALKERLGYCVHLTCTARTEAGGTCDGHRVKGNRRTRAYRERMAA